MAITGLPRPKIALLEIQDGGIRHLGFVFCNISRSLINEEGICVKFSLWIETGLTMVDHWGYKYQL